MTFKTIFSIVAICGTIGGTAYFLGTQNSKNIIIDDTESKKQIAEYQGIINQLQAQVERGEIAPKDQYMLNAIKKYGITNVIALALNGRYECPSAKEQVHDRCDPREEIAIMYNTLNLLKTGKYGDSLEKVIYHRMQNGVYMFSWVPKIQNKDTTSAIFKHSLELAFNVLGGNNEYEKYNYGQQYYCRQSISSCIWHKTSNRLMTLGRLNLNNEEVRSDWIKDSELSYHTFYREK